MIYSLMSGYKNYKNFQRNQPLYLHGLDNNSGVGFRDHEESDSDHNFRFVVVQYWIYNNLSLSVLKLC